MKLVAKKSRSASGGLSPHGVEFAELDSEVLLAALIAHVDGILAMATSGSVSDSMYGTLLRNYSEVRVTVDSLQAEVSKLDLKLRAVKGRIRDG